MSFLCRISLLTILFAAAPFYDALGQESLPDEPEQAAEPTQAEQTEQIAEPAHPQRIVDGRPSLYSFKRGVHPLTWLEFAIKPVFRSAESGWIHKLIKRTGGPEKTSGVAFGAGSIGSGTGLGPRVMPFHKDFLGRGIQVEIPLLYTYSHYQLYQLSASVPIVSQRKSLERLSFDLGMDYVSRARDDFFGIGNDSPEEDKTQYRLVSREARTGFTAKWNDVWLSNVRGVYRSVGITQPTGDTPSTQDQFDSASVPGLFGGTMGSIIFSIGRNHSKREDYTFKGGSDELEISFNDSLSGENFQFWRYRLYSQRFFPLSNDGRKVIAFRASVETNRPAGGNDVPFFDMPVLGTNQTLRGFDTFRFRDKTALSASLEYRYRIWRMMDFGLFVDQGQVAPQLGDLGLNRFHTGYGARLFLWPKPTFPISVDYGRSNETWRLYVNFNTIF